MNIARNKGKSKQKKRLQRKKVTIVSRKKKANRRKKPQVKKKKATVSVNTKHKREIQRLKRQVAALQRKRAKPEPGTLVSERSEAARRGWLTRRHNASLKAAQAIQQTVKQPSAPVTVQELTKSEIAKGVLSELDLLFFDRPEVSRQLIDLSIEKIPEAFAIGGAEWIQGKEPQIMVKLIFARIMGNFDEVAASLAEEYEYDAHDIYSLWYGYKLPD